MSEHVSHNVPEADEQYSLTKILAIWASVAVPMGLITWVIIPFLIPRVAVKPGLIFLSLITLGLVWQGVVSFIILKREVVPFTWETLKKRLWINHPIHPTTGVPSKKLYLWAVLGAVALIIWDQIGLFGGLDVLWVKALPAITQPEYTLLEKLPEVALGQWWLLALLLPFTAFNYVLGEELLFRGVLLPKMHGVFGKWDWLANAMIFTLYHLHQPWEIPSQLILRDWIYPGYNKYFKSFWMSCIIHGSFNTIILYIVVTFMIMGKL
ncbi:MAG: CPBP family intramembrane metalloprotease [bacterium]|nr:CPBP family intramembrane metalloprotease [bacterium]